jgi:hypothetical protein
MRVSSPNPSQSDFLSSGITLRHNRPNHRQIHLTILVRRLRTWSRPHLGNFLSCRRPNQGSWRQTQLTPVIGPLLATPLTATSVSPSRLSPSPLIRCLSVTPHQVASPRLRCRNPTPSRLIQRITKRSNQRSMWSIGHGQCSSRNNPSKTRKRTHSTLVNTLTPSDVGGQSRWLKAHTR